MREGAWLWGSDSEGVEGTGLGRGSQLGVFWEGQARCWLI